jgi:hypothetical protein
LAELGRKRCWDPINLRWGIIRQVFIVFNLLLGSQRRSWGCFNWRLNHAVLKLFLINFAMTAVGNLFGILIWTRCFILFTFIAIFGLSFFSLKTIFFWRRSFLK